MARQNSSALVLIIGGGAGVLFLAGVTLAVLYFNGVFGTSQAQEGPPPNFAGAPMPPNFKGGPGFDPKGGLPFDPKGGPPLDPKGGPPFDPKGPPGLPSADWQVREVPVACKLLTPCTAIEGADPDERSGRKTYACPTPTTTVMISLGKLPEEHKKDAKAYLQSIKIAGLKLDKTIDQGGSPAVELVPEDATKETERITRVIVAGSSVYQIDVMRGMQPVDRKKADEVFDSFKQTK